MPSIEASYPDYRNVKRRIVLDAGHIGSPVIGSDRHYGNYNGELYVVQVCFPSDEVGAAWEIRGAFPTLNDAKKFCDSCLPPM